MNRPLLHPGYVAESLCNNYRFQDILRDQLTCCNPASLSPQWHYETGLQYVCQLIPQYILEFVIIAERVRNVSWMQYRVILPSDEELMVALRDRGVPLSAGRTLLLLEKKVCELVTEKHHTRCFQQITTQVCLVVFQVWWGSYLRANFVPFGIRTFKYFLRYAYIVTGSLLVSARMRLHAPLDRWDLLRWVHTGRSDDLVVFISATPTRQRFH